MEPEGSLPCSQKPFTGLYPEPDKSKPYHLILWLWTLVYVCVTVNCKV
jgi:hypothetical protein